MEVFLIFFSDFQYIISLVTFQHPYTVSPFSSLIEAISAERALRIVDHLWRSQFWLYAPNEAKDTFYITYAQTHCAGGVLGQLAKGRVNSLLRNKPSFSFFYECAEDAYMNGAQNSGCVIWTDGSTHWNLGEHLIDILLVVIIFSIVIGCILKKRKE